MVTIQLTTNAKIKIDNEKITLFSYHTRVAQIDTLTGWLDVYGLHSTTTRKHISKFMEMYTNYDYKLAKQLAENYEQFNLYTGEVKAR